MHLKFLEFCLKLCVHLPSCGRYDLFSPSLKLLPVQVSSCWWCSRSPWVYLNFFIFSNFQVPFLIFPFLRLTLFFEFFLSYGLTIFYHRRICIVIDLFSPQTIIRILCSLHSIRLCLLSYLICRFLLEKNADLLIRDAEQNIALHWATYSGTTSIAELLLNYGSEINCTNIHGDTPL